jgi:intracellular sulfur oxidation DsrE/DsrF family protein
VVNLSRKELLAAGAAVLLPVTGAAQIASAAPSATPAPFVFDDARFQSILGIPARHKQCVASAVIEGGEGLYAMMAALYAYEFDMREGPGTVHEVAVLYHPQGAMLGLGDRAWNEYLIPALSHLRARVGTLRGRPIVPGRGNPYLRRDRSLPLETDPSIEALASRGCHFFVCNNALNGLASMLASALHESDEAIYAGLRADLVPNALVVPAGVMAINACQEAHFTYLQATL